MEKQLISLAKKFNARWGFGPWFQGPHFPTRIAQGVVGDPPGLDVLGWIHIGTRSLPEQSMAPSLPFWGMVAPLMVFMRSGSMVEVAVQIGGVTVVAYTIQALTGVVGRAGANLGQIQAEVVFQSIRVMDGTGTLILAVIVIMVGHVVLQG